MKKPAFLLRFIDYRSSMPASAYKYYYFPMTPAQLSVKRKFPMFPA